MRILTFLLIISLSHFTRGQNITTKFKDTVVFDDFSTNRYNLPQKYNSLELTIVEDGTYRMKRLNDEGKSIAYIKQEKPIFGYEVAADLTIAKESGKDATAGLVLNGQTSRGGGIFIEVSNKKQFKVYKVSGSQVRLLSGTALNGGWLKTKHLKKKKSNNLRVRFEDGYYDIFLNQQYVYTVYETQFKSGKVGFWCGALTTISVDNLLLKTDKDKLPKLADENINPKKESGVTDPAFQEVILLFKTKIDKQQVEIAKLEREVNKCKSMLNYDTTLVERASRLSTENQLLSFKLDSASKELRISKKRLVYLESLKEDIEAGTNGDLVLNLTTILANVKGDFTKLKNESKVIEAQNKKLTKDNAVLLREIDRMRNLLEMQE